MPQREIYRFDLVGNDLYLSLDPYLYLDLPYPEQEYPVR